ncbi:MAG: hypothetical protein AAF471_07215 [Myxococcota bacterium]
MNRVSTATTSPCRYPECRGSGAKDLPTDRSFGDSRLRGNDKKSRSARAG